MTFTTGIAVALIAWISRIRPRIAALIGGHSRIAQRTLKYSTILAGALLIISCPLVATLFIEFMGFRWASKPTSDVGLILNLMGLPLIFGVPYFGILNAIYALRSRALLSDPRVVGSSKARTLASGSGVAKAGLTFLQLLNLLGCLVVFAALSEAYTTVRLTEGFRAVASEYGEHGSPLPTIPHDHVLSLFAIGIAIHAASFMAILFWANKIGRQAGLGPYSGSRLWALFGWFIPGVNLLWPRVSIDETWRSLLHAFKTGRRDWHKERAVFPSLLAAANGVTLLSWVFALLAQASYFAPTLEIAIVVPPDLLLSFLIATLCITLIYWTVLLWFCARLSLAAGVHTTSRPDLRLFTPSPAP